MINATRKWRHVIFPCWICAAGKRDREATARVALAKPLATASSTMGSSV